VTPPTDRQLANISPAPNPARLGNSRALSHGATSQQRLGPLRELHAIELRRDYPHLDDRRLAILADRLARLDSARRWLDQQNGVVRNAKGETYPVVANIDKWGGAAERRLDLIEAEARAPVPADERLREHLAARTEGGST